MNQILYLNKLLSAMKVVLHVYNFFSKLRSIKVNHRIKIIMKIVFNEKADSLNYSFKVVNDPF